MNVLQMRGFTAQVEVMGKAVDVRFNGDALTLSGLTLADVHAILGALSTGQVTQEDGDALPLKPAAPDGGNAESADGSPTKPKATRKGPRARAVPVSEIAAHPTKSLRAEDYVEPEEPEEPSDTEVAADMRAQLDAGAEAQPDEEEPENPCPDCGAELGENDGECEACTAFEDKGRAITARMKANRGKGTTEPKRPRGRKGSAAKPNPSPDKDPPRVPEADDPLAPEGGVPEELASAMRLRQVVGYMLDHGFKEEKDIIAECERIKNQVPVLSRVNNLPERIGRTLAVMDTGQL